MLKQRYLKSMRHNTIIPTVYIPSLLFSSGQVVLLVHRTSLVSLMVSMLPVLIEHAKNMQDSFSTGLFQDILKLYTDSYVVLPLLGVAVVKHSPSLEHCTSRSVILVLFLKSK